MRDNNVLLLRATSHLFLKFEEFPYYILMVARILIKKHPFREIEASLSQIWLKPDNSGVSL